MKDDCPWYVELPITEPPRFITYPGVVSNQYTITDFGLITNINRHFTIQQSVSNGYCKCTLNRNDEDHHFYLVHRLVAWEFVPYRRDINLQVNHIDGNKLNNNYWNLEWVTQIENSKHAHQNGLVSIKKGVDHYASVLDDNDVHLICKLVQDPCNSFEYISKTLNHKVSCGVINAIARGSNWKHISKFYSPFPNRSRAGQNHSKTKLTNEDVNLVCTMLQDPRNSYEDIMNFFLGNNVTISSIKHIAHGETWTHISKAYDFSQRKRHNK